MLNNIDQREKAKVFLRYFNVTNFYRNGIVLKINLMEKGEGK